MSRYKDLSGNTYGQLTVLSFSHVDDKRVAWFNCVCSCGVECKKRSYNLTKGNTISCGCYTPNRIKDITGQTFGRLKVKEFVRIDEKAKVALWHCICKCGKEAIVRGTSLRYGVKSCGCLADENPKGKDSPAWKGGITPENLRQRTTVKYLAWRTKVFTRDNFTCQKCFCKSKNLNAHHLRSFSKYPEYRTRLSNGITLCEKCHRTFHKEFGQTNNTPGQMKKFLNKI